MASYITECTTAHEKPNSQTDCHLLLVIHEVIYYRNSYIKTNVLAPILDEIDLKFTTKQIVGEDEDTDHSIFRQPPSPAVDAAWNNLSNLNSIWVSSSDIVRMGKDPKSVAKYPESFNLGLDAYAAELDSLHKIHCLNSLRKEIYFDYYFGDKYPDGKTPELHQAHTSHCLYVLLQHLMCEASTDIVTREWVEGQIHPYPDFSINRQCGDFNALLKWQEGRRVTNDEFRAWRMPEGHVPKPVSDEFKRVFGYGNGPNDPGHSYQHD
jgi:Mycotoxin biosynthesis protein UstYa